MEFAQAKYDFRGNQTVAVARHGDDSSVFAEFYDKPILLEAESSRQGRPIYKEVTYCRITFPADRTKTWDQPVKMEDDANGPSDPHRFPRQWAAYQAQQEQIPDGTPLAEFPAFNRARVWELRAMNIHTVEQYAAVPDTSDLGLGWKKEREMCQAYLNKSASLAQVTQLQSENESLRADVEMLRQQIKDLGSMVRQGDETGPAVRRGRPPNIKEA